MIESVLKFKKTAFSLFLLISILFPSVILAQEKVIPLTNENFLRKTINDVLQDCLTEAPFDSQLVWIEEEEGNPSAWIVKEEVVSFLKKRGPVGMTKRDEREKSFLTLSFRIIKLSLEYPEIKRKNLFGKSRVRREAQVALSFNLNDSEGRVLWSKRGERGSSDLLKKEEIFSLNNKQYSFLSPQIPEGSWGRLVEPAVVTVVAGALIYLFFANR
ncbi:MAG: hypothetical protein MUO78_07055 [candidate division Zixibacteria bacterium]|nr:hypothetical protein [candidate division Zixibacteria bacterium]